MLLYHYNERVIQQPPVPPLDRKNIKTSEVCGSEREDSDAVSIAFTLRRSGRAIRKIDSSPPMSVRTWKALESNAIACKDENTSNQAVLNKQLLAETCYVIKPIAHLGCMACFGSKAWKPWLLAIALDYYR